MIALCTIITLGSLAGWLYSERKSARASLEASMAKATAATLESARRADQESIRDLSAKLAAARKEAAHAREALETALGQSRDWAATPVPKEVQEALRGAV